MSIIDLASERARRQPVDEPEPELQVLVSRYPGGRIVVDSSGPPDHHEAMVELLVEAIDCLGCIIEDPSLDADSIRVVVEE